MIIVTRHANALTLQTAKDLGIPYKVLDNTTLNEKFGILENEVLPDNVMPTTKFSVIGRGAHFNKSGANNAQLTGLYKHEADSNALFEHLPFVIRRLDDDLPTALRKNYCGREVRNIGGTDYVLYWVRRHDVSNLEVKLYNETTIDGNSTEVEYVPSSTSLSPTPKAPTTPSQGVNVVNTSEITARTILDISISDWEAEEIRKACVILHGSEEYATISEIALVSGVDKDVDSADPNRPVFTYKEAYALQLQVSYSLHENIWSSNKGVEFTVNAGGSEDLTL